MVFRGQSLILIAISYGEGLQASIVYSGVPFETGIKACSHHTFENMLF